MPPQITLGIGSLKGEYSAMRYATLGRSDLRLSVITLGTWLTFGETVDAAGARELLAGAKDAGINAIDTANGYAYGEAERLIGQALQDFPRDAFVLMTKCFFSADPARPEPEGLSKTAIADAVEASLKRLRTGCIDLLQCHRFDPHTPLTETVQAMEALAAAGKIRYWGVSKWSDAQITRALADGADHLVAHQELYNLFHRQPEATHFDFCRKGGIGFLAYSPLARGVLTGKYLHGIPRGSRGAHAEHKQTLYDLAPEKQVAVQALTAMAEEKGCTAAQLALAFYLQRPALTSVIIGATNTRQLTENAAAADIALSAAESHAIATLFAEYV